MAVDIDVLTFVVIEKPDALFGCLLDQQLIEAVPVNGVDGLAVLPVRKERGVPMFVMHPASIHRNDQRLDTFPQADLFNSFLATITQRQIDGSAKTLHT